MYPVILVRIKLFFPETDLINLNKQITQISNKSIAAQQGPVEQLRDTTQSLGCCWMIDSTQEDQGVLLHVQIWIFNCTFIYMSKHKQES